MPSKHILLLHISEVSGHRSASLAIEKAIKAKSPQTTTLSLNAFNYVHPRGEKIINFFYMLMIKRVPFLWAHLYDNPYWLRRSRRIKKLIHHCNLSKLDALFNDFSPDAVVTTQAFPCGMLADFKRVKNIDLPLVAVLTDFVPHSYWIYDAVDYYITPSEEIKQRLIDKGVSEQRIKTFGIPIDSKFCQNFNKSQIRKKLNLQVESFTILIMGGGQGLGPIKNIIKALENLTFDLQEIVVCGTNRRIYRWLRKRLSNYKQRLSLFDYVDNIDELMSAADLIITKPGGVTCAEALSKGLPMLIISPIPGQEANNTAYLIKQGAAVKVDKPADLVKIVNDLYNRRNKLNQLSSAAVKISNPDAADNIAQLLLQI